MKNKNITYKKYMRYSIENLELKINDINKQLKLIEEFNKPLKELWNKYEKAKLEAEHKEKEIINKYGNLVKPIRKWKKKYKYFGEEIAVPFTSDELKTIDLINEKSKLILDIWSPVTPLRPKVGFKSNGNLLEELNLLKKAYNLKSKKQKIADKKVKLNEETKAIAANAISKGRELADTFKSKISKTEFCPYCNQLLTNPHLDHIYPISKGGNSSSTNLVYVCQSCNLKKSNLTLRNFIKKYNLDKDKIEDTLESLGKDF